MKEDSALRLSLLFIALSLILFFLYGKGVYNFYFSDDFEWLSRSLLVPSDPSEILRVKGRDFSPLFLSLLTLFTSLSGSLSPVPLRIFTLLVLALLGVLLFRRLTTLYGIPSLPILLSLLLFLFHPYLSESFLNLSALVYPLSLLLFLCAVGCAVKERPLPFFLLATGALFMKESSLLLFLPLPLLPPFRGRRAVRLYLFPLLIPLLLRWGIQLGRWGVYSSFVDKEEVALKFSLLFQRSLGFPPYFFSPLSALLLSLLLFSGLFLLLRRRPGGLYFPALWFLSLLFFSLFPKLSGRYLLFPLVGAIGTLALASAWWLKRRPASLALLLPLLALWCLFQGGVIRREVESYRELGEFSRLFLQGQREILLRNYPLPSGEGVIVGGGTEALRDLYGRVQSRGGLPKLLPLRVRGVNGVMEPEDLVPLSYWPERRVRWVTREWGGGVFFGSFQLLGGS